MKPLRGSTKDKKSTKEKTKTDRAGKPSPAYAFFRGFRVFRGDGVLSPIQRKPLLRATSRDAVN
jgi:hypothetical protein